MPEAAEKDTPEYTNRRAIRELKREMYIPQTTLKSTWIVCDLCNICKSSKIYKTWGQIVLKPSTPSKYLVY